MNGLVLRLNAFFSSEFLFILNMSSQSWNEAKSLSFVISKRGWAAKVFFCAREHPMERGVHSDTDPIISNPFSLLVWCVLSQSTKLIIFFIHFLLLRCSLVVYIYGIVISSYLLKITDNPSSPFYIIMCINGQYTCRNHHISQHSA